MGAGCIMLPGGLEVVVESGASNNPIVISNPKLSTPTVVWCFLLQLPLFFSFPLTPMFHSVRLTHLRLPLIRHYSSSDSSSLTLDLSSDFFLTHCVSP